MSEHKTVAGAGPAASETKPGAQAASRDRCARPAGALDADEHLATVEQALDQPDEIGVFLSKFEEGVVS